MTNEELEALEGRYVVLIERHRSLIRGLCWRRSRGDINRCTELVQGCYLALWRAMPKLHEGIPLRQERSWVAWQCRNALSHLLGRKRHWWLPLDTVADTLEADTGLADRERLEELAEGLSPREWRYLQLLLDGYNTDEIADMLQIKPDSVYKMRRRVIDKMKQNANLQSYERRNQPPADA